jgi:aspartate carbamoyltransferase catalytic subunit
VARSNLHCLKLLGASVILVGPPTLVPRALEAFGAELVSDLDAVLPRVDALMMLRLQTERMTDAFIPGPEEYRRRFGLDSDRVTRLKASAVVLHPGPVNRGLEIAPEVADGPRSLILEQVANGVAVRKAILEVLT